MEFNATFIVAFFSFIVFIVLMNKILYKPMCNIIQKRKKYIEETFALANNNIEAREAILQTRLDKIHSQELICSKKTKQSLDEFHLNQNYILKKTKQEALNSLNQAKEDIKLQSNQTKEELIGDVAKLAQKISDKFLQDEEKIQTLTKEQFERLMS